MCGTECCDKHFPEWKKESTWCWFFVKLVLLAIVTAIWFAVAGMEFGWIDDIPEIFEPAKLLIVIAFMIIVGFLTIIYTPWMHQIAPWWFKILAIVLYFGTLLWFFWEIHIAEPGQGLIPDVNTNDQAFDLWTINHTFVGVLFGVMFPFWWMLLVVIGWEILELEVYGVGDENFANLAVDIIVAVIGWAFVIAIFSRKCIPWISARCAVETKKRAESDRNGITNASDEYDTYGTEMGTHI
mmetsp:Transcript_32275/g.28328  ORF Transcript_32275/g.28328 Transcript_32275/m.28328 type:complete len:240 (+) Transcript_32275:84-803(+)